jgi:hypothetical protein
MFHVRSCSLSSDYSEIKIKLMFDAAAPAPNFGVGWNKLADGAVARCDSIGEWQTHCEDDALRLAERGLGVR